MRDLKFGLGLVVAAALVCTFAGAAASRPEQAVKVTVRLDFRHSEAHTGWFAARDNGFYQRAGLDVEISPGAGSVSTIQQVASGNNTFGYASAIAMTQQVAQGADVVMVASQRQLSDGGIAYWPQSGISTPRDLEGKTCGLTASGFIALLFPTWADRVGLNRSRVNTRILDGTVGSSLFGAGRLDCLEATVPQLLFFPVRDGVAPRIFRYSSAGMNALGFGIIANSRQAQGSPGLVTRFVRATLEAWAWACANPREAVTNARKYVTTTNSFEVGLATWEAVCGFSHTAASKGRQLGWMAIEDWRTTVNLLRSSPELGLTRNIPPPVSLYTNRFVPAAKVAATLSGTVGPQATITLRRGATPVATLAAGTYRVAVRDRSSQHGFRLRGPGVNVAITGTADEGSGSVTVFLRPGRYVYLSDRAPARVRGSFRVE